MTARSFNIRASLDSTIPSSTNARYIQRTIALRWQCFDHAECTMRLVETVYKGKIRPWGKTRKSLGVVHVPKDLADDLWLWKQGCPNPSPESFMFPNKKGGFMDSNNYRKRVLQRLEQELELPKLTFQVIRRTIATLAQKKGTVKDIQGLLRHSRMATTTDVYMQEIPESVQKTVDAISAELRLLPNLEEVTLGTSDLLPNATKLKSGVSAST
jgi:integrase